MEKAKTMSSVKKTKTVSPPQNQTIIPPFSTKKAIITPVKKIPVTQTSMVKPVVRRASHVQTQNQPSMISQTTRRSTVVSESALIKKDLTLLEEAGVNPMHQKASNEKKNSYNLEKGLTFEVKTLQKYFQFNGEEQNIPIMVSVRTADETSDQIEEQKLESVKEEESRASVDLVCVIDNSGSMQGTKIETVKTTLLQLLDMLKGEDRLSLILFNSDASMLCNLRRVDGEDRLKIRNIIKSITSMGGTDINAGMRMAFKVLQNRKQANVVSSVFLLSDGQDGGADLRIKEYLQTNEQKLKDNCFTIHSFGFGSDHDGPLMNRICDLRDGNFYYVEKVDQIDEFFVDALGGLFSIVAQDVQIEVNFNFIKHFSSGIVSKMYGDKWKIIKQNQKYAISISQLFSGISKDFMLEVTLPASVNPKTLEDSDRNIELLTAQLSAIPIDITYTTKVLKDANLVLTLFTSGEKIAEDSEINDSVEFNYLRVKAASAMEEAIHFSENQMFDQGQKVLSSMISKIEHSHPKNKEKLLVIRKDLLICQESAKPQVYENEGKYKMLSKKAANFKQSSQAVDEADIFQNKMQKSMVKKQKMSKQ